MAFTWSLTVCGDRRSADALTERFPGMRLAPGAQLQHIPVPLFRGFTSLPVVWDT